MSVTEAAVSKVGLTQQQLLDVALNRVAVHIPVVAIVGRRYVITGITHRDTGSAEIPEAIRYRPAGNCRPA